MKRSEAEEKVKAMGGSAKSTVVKDLSYLVTNDTGSGSAKNKKAGELGIPIIDENAFCALLEKSGAKAGAKTAARKTKAQSQGELF
jgi:DNA ligase (NAD+)